ncbi:MAG: hypothetical protein GF401_06900 [Chitinivibrionales bacterium]|nr:hypothetical protein [Chitinivibrionales bacterium]
MSFEIYGMALHTKLQWFFLCNICIVIIMSILLVVTLRMRMFREKIMPIVCILFCFLLLCTPPPSGEQLSQIAQQSEKEKEGDSIVHTSPAVQKQPVYYEVDKWEGKRFVLLKKTAMFQRFGYLLYLTPALADATGPVNDVMELSSRRIKYHLFAGAYVTVSSVKPDTHGEYRITCISDIQSLPLYGKTSGGVIEGLALADDLEGASDRWMNTTVYSRRRAVEMFDSTASRFQSRKVSVLDPLNVFDVTWGRTPLPTKPIWIHVECPDSSRAIIPVHYSWTNVVKEKRGKGLPWKEEIFEHNPQELYTWDPLFWDAIDNHKLLIGMNTKQVELSWGIPEKKGKDWKSDTLQVDVWLYSGNRLVFHNDSLVLSEVR